MYSIGSIERISKPTSQKSFKDVHINITPSFVAARLYEKYHQTSSSVYFTKALRLERRITHTNKIKSENVQARTAMKCKYHYRENTLIAFYLHSHRQLKQHGLPQTLSDLLGCFPSRQGNVTVMCLDILYQIQSLVRHGATALVLYHDILVADQCGIQINEQGHNFVSDWANDTDKKLPNYWLEVPIIFLLSRSFEPRTLQILPIVQSGRQHQWSKLHESSLKVSRNNKRFLLSLSSSLSNYSL